MKATIWHNPACGTSRKTLAILEETPGVEVDVVQYLKTPYTADKLRQLFADAGLTGDTREVLQQIAFAGERAAALCKDILSYARHGGAVREVAEMILKAQDKWDKVLAKVG